MRRRSTLLTDVDSTQPLDFGHQHAQGLVGMWKVLPQYTGGSVLRDLSVYRRDATLVSMTPASDWITGRNGLGALNFDGVDDNLNLGTLGSFGSIIPSGSTIETWINTTESGSITTLLATLNNGFTTLLSITLNRAQDLSQSDGKTNFELRDQDSQYRTGHITTNIYDGEWHHLAWCVDTATTWRIYVDGRSQSLTTIAHAGTPDNTADFQYPLLFGGANNRGTPVSFSAVLCEKLSLYNRALTASEIASIYEDTLTGRYDLLRRVSRRTFSIPAAVTPTTTTAGRVRRKYTRKATLLTDVDSTQPLDTQHPHAAGLVGMWKVLPQYTGGTTLRDLSLSRNDGTLENMSPPEDWVAGRDGLGALDLAGSNDRINVAGLLGEAVDNTKCTIMGWVKTDTVSVYHEMLGFGDASEITGARFGQNGTKIHGAVRINGTWKWRVNTTSGYLSVGVWTHIAMIHDGVEPHFYVNGDEKSLTYVVGTDKTAWLPDDPDWDTAHIGVLYWNGAYSEYWDGQLDDIRIYNRALTASEIADIYEDSLTGRYDLLRRVSRRTFSIPGAAPPAAASYWMWARQTGAQIIGGGVA